MHQENKPNRKELSLLKKIEIFKLLENNSNVPEIAYVTGVSLRTIYNYRKQLNAFSPTDCKRMAEKLEREFLEGDLNSVPDYEKQDACLHNHMSIHCEDCGLWVSEQDPDKMIAEIEKHRVGHKEKYLIEVTL